MSLPDYYAPLTPPAVFYPGPAPVAPMEHRRGAAASALITALLVVLVILILWALIVAGAEMALARRLRRRGWVVYLLRGCGHCEKQMRLLDGFDGYVLCGKGGRQLGGLRRPPLACGAVAAFPYWYNTKTGAARKGYQDRAALAQMARRSQAL